MDDLCKRLLFLATVILIITLCRSCKAEMIGTASWYSQASVKKEGKSGVMANGKIYDEDVYTCAIWDKKFGTILKVTNLNTGLSVEAVVSDRGPSKKFVKQGRIIDLSKAAFKKICPLEKGLCKVKLEVIDD